MRKQLIILVVALAATSLLGCVTPEKRPEIVQMDEEAEVITLRNLDFKKIYVWHAATRALRDFFDPHREHPYFNANDLDWCFKDMDDPTDEEKEYNIIRSHYIPSVKQVPVVGKEFARRATIKILPDGEGAWQCQIKLIKYERRRLPVKERDEAWQGVAHDIQGAREIADLILLELEKIIEKKRKGVPEREL